ncbi:L-asparaginase [Aphis craccivora]|uniref:L-asparaginase n=1 Tax=Aphis craccivora TaxID=307492 RepID=A0A6G0YZT5_APHCR|nr:L-asparaginase [Aphis craccivora]
MDQNPQQKSQVNGDIVKGVEAITISVSADKNGTDGVTEQRPYVIPSPSHLGSTPSQSYLGSTPPQSFRRRCDSMTANEDGDQNESKVLVIYTGGTIGMIRNDDNSKRIKIIISRCDILFYYQTEKIFINE